MKKSHAIWFHLFNIIDIKKLQRWRTNWLLLRIGMVGKETGKIIPTSFQGSMLLVLLLSRLSCVRLCVTPEMASHQAPPSLGFSREEHWSGLPFPSPMRESEFAQPCPTLRDPMDCSLPGSSVHGIFQARVLEWGAIAFSELSSGICLILCSVSRPGCALA